MKSSNNQLEKYNSHHILVKNNFVVIKENGVTFVKETLTGVDASGVLGFSLGRKINIDDVKKIFNNYDSKKNSHLEVAGALQNHDSSEDIDG